MQLLIIGRIKFSGPNKIVQIKLVWHRKSFKINYPSIIQSQICIICFSRNTLSLCSQNAVDSVHFEIRNKLHKNIRLLYKFHYSKIL